MGKKAALELQQELKALNDYQFEDSKYAFKVKVG